MKGFLFMAAIVFALACKAGEEPSPWKTGEKIPDGIRITLTSEKTNYFLGENILLYYRIENTGTNTFQISVGGDYRGSTRSDRFKVVARSSNGEPVVDPTPLMRNMGGLMPNGELKPGDRWFENVYAIRYCRFERDGTYTIQVFHDLGFGERKSNDPREAVTRVNLRAPTEQQAREILSNADRAEPYNGNTWGKKGESRLDYECIRHPAFLNPLTERARNGSLPAMKGIASIRTVEATRVLAGLLREKNSAFATEVATALEFRLPRAANDSKSPWFDYQKQFVIEDVWEEELNPVVQEFALQRLKTTRHADYLLAASLLKRIGTKEQIPALIEALELALAQTNAEFLADIRYPPPARACDSVVGAVCSIDPRGNNADRAESAGQLLLYMAGHGGADRTLNEDEQAVFAKALKHSLPYVRMKALEDLPTDIPATLMPMITERMTDSNLAVQNYAFVAAERIDNPAHREIALQVMNSAQDEWLRRGAQNIARKYGSPYECALVWVSHLKVPRDINDYTAHEAIRELFEITTGSGSGGGSFDPALDEARAKDLRDRWVVFLTANQEKIERGYHFKLGDADMPADLLPGGFHFQ